MSALRVLGVSYLATASLFSLAIFFSDHDALRLMTMRETDSLARQFQTAVSGPLLTFARLEDEKIFDPQASVHVSVAVSAPGPNDARLLAHADVPRLPQRVVTAPQLAAPEPLIIAPDLPQIEAGQGYGGSISPALPKFVPPEVANLLPPDLEGASALSADERSAVTQRLGQSMTPEMLKNFALFLYVSKARKGPLAQRLYVFRKDSTGALQLAYDWAASTGREEYEVSPLGAHTRTTTPAGIYEIDPDRMYRAYHSHAWDQSMPYAMFFNWENNGDQTGLAIHAAVGNDVEKLGNRASAGCVHISPQHARLLFDMIRNNYKGKVPRLAYDPATHSTSNQGALMRDVGGNLVMANGYKVLIDIEDFSGASRIAALN